MPGRKKPMTASNIISSFKATGVCPFNRLAVKLPGMEEKEEFSSFQPESHAQRTGLAYIPLYSPSNTHCSSHASLTRAAASRTPLRSLHQSPTSFSCSESHFLEKSLLGTSLSESCYSPNEQPVDNYYHSSVPLRKATGVSNLLIPPLPLSKAPTKHAWQILWLCSYKPWKFTKG